MTASAPSQAQPAGEAHGLGPALRAYVGRVRAGDVGSLPVVVALILITIFFSSKTSVFFTATNFNNLVVQTAGTATIAIGVVFVLLLGEIDLSIGYVSGIGGVVVAELQMAGTAHNLGGFGAIVFAVLTGVAIGAAQGWFVAKVGVPSFVVTLAGLLIAEGMILKALGVEGVIGIQSNLVNDVANYHFSPLAGWILAAVVTFLYALGAALTWRSRRRAGLDPGDLTLTVLRVGAIGVAAFGSVAICNHATHPTGVPFAGVLVVALVAFWSYIARRTTFGRHVYAVGGNAEAARRAGISVARIRILVFMISGGMAALGGVVLAARLSSVDLTAGSGTILLDSISAAVIGGTSLFGGRGWVRSALLGALVIKTIENGLDLIGQTDWVKDVTTGVILLAAVTLDTVSRRRLERSGR